MRPKLCLVVGLIAISVFVPDISNPLHASVTLYVSPDGSQAGVTCTDSGENIASLDAIYLTLLGSDINTPTTGYDTPNPMNGGCPGDVLLYGVGSSGSSNAQNVLSNMVSHPEYQEEILEIKIDPAGSAAVFYGDLYICSGATRFSKDSLADCVTESTSTATTTGFTYSDTLLTNTFIIFLLSFPVWGLVFSVFKPKPV